MDIVEAIDALKNSHYDGCHCLNCQIIETIRKALVEGQKPTTNTLQAVIDDLIYVNTVIEGYGVISGSKCHKMVKRSVARLTAMQ